MRLAFSTTLIGLFALMPTPSSAQVIPDATLSNNTTININGTTINIEGGTRLGNNLFHSLREFSVPTGSTVHFNNPIGIEAIITRITGGSVSNIDGLIRANGASNLFLINPSGIVFGPNARLDIGGSLFVTTADSLEFADGSSFSAVNPQQPLLTVSIPIIGLRFSGNSGSITVQGTGEGLTGFSVGSTPVGTNLNNTGISVNPGRTLSLVGGTINLTGATLFSAGGTINLVSINSGLVRFDSSNTGSFNFDSTNSYKNITISEKSLVDTSGNQGGFINLFASNVSINSGSALLIQNRDLSSGNINIQGREKIEISGISQTDQRFYTTVRTESLGTGRAGNLNISTKNLVIEGGGNLASRNYNSGNGGDITVNADNLNLTGFSSFNPSASSNIVTSTLSSGTAGNINITARRVTADDGGTISSLARGQTGVSGNLTINASDSIELNDSMANSGINYAPSAFVSATTGAGNAGTVEINTNKLTLQPKTSINTSTLSTGDAGTVNINARNLEVMGSINSSATRATELQQSAFGVPPIPSGSPGEVIINSNLLNITDGGEVAVVNEGTGDAGTLSIKSNTISVGNQGAISATTTSGQGGDINLDSQNIRLSNGNISATAGGTGDGGNIDIDTKSLILQNNSTITANAFEGRGGNITIDTQGFFISRDSLITASSERGIDGTVQINAPQLDLLSSGIKNQYFQPNLAFNTCSPEPFSLPDELTIFPKGGFPRSPDDYLTPIWGWTDPSAPIPTKPLAQTQTQTQTQNTENIVVAQAWRNNGDGTVNFTITPDPAGDITAYSSPIKSPCIKRATDTRSTADGK